MAWYGQPTVDTPLLEDPLLPFLQFVLPPLWDKFTGDPNALDYERLADDLNSNPVLIQQLRSQHVRIAFEFFRRQRHHFVPNSHPYPIPYTEETTGNEREHARNKQKEGATKSATAEQSDATSGPRYPCEFCSKLLESRKSWMDHRNRKCFPRRGNFRCPVCKLLYTRRDNLIKHIRKKHPGKMNSPPTSLEAERNNDDQSYPQIFHQKCSYCVQKKYPSLDGSKVGAKEFPNRAKSDSHIFEHMDKLVSQGYELEWVDCCTPQHETWQQDHEQDYSQSSPASINPGQPLDEDSVGSSHHQPAFINHPQGPDFGDFAVHDYGSNNNYATASSQGFNEPPFGLNFDTYSQPNNFEPPRRAISLQGDNGDASRPPRFSHAGGGGRGSSAMSLHRREHVDTQSCSRYSHRSAPTRRFANRQQSSVQSDGPRTPPGVERWLNQPWKDDPFGRTVESNEPILPDVENLYYDGYG